MVSLFSVVYPHSAKEAGGILITGWLSFARYIAARCTLEWNAIGMSLICAMIALGALHWVGRWFSRQFQSHWTSRSTVATSLFVCWLFVLTMTSAGLGRSLYALAFGPEGNVVLQTRALEAVGAAK
jgi:hypothetical protein